MSSYVFLNQDFRLSPSPLGLGGLAMYARYNRDAYVGQLCNRLLGVLYKTPFVAASKVEFSLVNVTNLMNRSSAGKSPTPPIDTHGCKWLFTFALTANNYTAMQMPYRVLPRQFGTYVWELEPGRPQFVTVGITPYEAEQYQLGSDMFLSKFLYYMVGAYTKSAILNQRWKLEGPDVEDFSGYYKSLMPLYKNNVLRPLSVCIITRPVHEWVFSRAIWNQTPGLLSTKHIVPFTVAYFLSFLGGVDRLYYGAYRPLFDQIFHMLRVSLISVIARSASGDRATELTDVLYWGLFPDTFVSEDPIEDLFAADERSVRGYADTMNNQLDEQIKQLFFDQTPKE